MALLEKSDDQLIKNRLLKGSLVGAVDKDECLSKFLCKRIKLASTVS